MPMVRPPSWQDMLADETHELETRARLDDPLANSAGVRMLMPPEWVSDSPIALPL